MHPGRQRERHQNALYAKPGQRLVISKDVTSIVSSMVAPAIGVVAEMRFPAAWTVVDGVAAMFKPEVLIGALAVRQDYSDSLDSK
jgi:hypothetical protein